MSKVRQLVAEKLLKVEAQLIALATMRDDLRLILIDWDKQLLTVSEDTQAGLLENLVLPSVNKHQSPLNKQREKGKKNEKI